MNPYCRLSNGLSASYCFHQVNPENEQSPHLILQVLGENQSANELVLLLSPLVCVVVVVVVGEEMALEGKVEKDPEEANWTNCGWNLVL